MTDQNPQPVTANVTTYPQGTYDEKVQFLLRDSEVFAMWQDVCEVLKDVYGFARADTMRAAVVFLYENSDAFMDDYDERDAHNGGWQI